MGTRLAGKVCVITGAGSGIGRESALLFAREGAKVVVADVNDAGGEETVRLIREAGGEAIYVHTDVTRAAEVEALVRTAEETYGKLDVMFNNAGIFPDEDGSVVDTPEEVWDRVMAVNLKGVFLGCK
ncbi:MAG: SDR family oxidoreductase, partial [Thermomicrobium sp.]|nr:SDR family oxidoreductase [Thermomicrobium sp.]